LNHTEGSADEVKRAVCVVLFDENNKILSVSRKNDPNDLNLPGGSVEKDETLEQAVFRETYEETGLMVYNLEPVFTVLDSARYLVTTFIGEYTGTPTKKEEGVVKWVDPVDITKGSFGEYNKKLLEIIGVSV